MMDFLCMDCDYCKTDRKNAQGQVRCTRISRFVNPNDMACKEFHKEVSDVKELRKLFNDLEFRG